MSGKRDLLTLRDLGAQEILGLLARAVDLKAARARAELRPLLEGLTLGMIFEKASTRTRVSFEVAMVELGGHAVYLAPEGTQMGRGEPIRDTARVLGSYCHGIVIRTFAQERCEELARYAPIPVVNGLTDESHPCQVLADLMTVYEHVGQEGLERARYAWIGDGNNMANSWMDAAAILGLDLTLACPAGYEPDRSALERAQQGKGKIAMVRSPADAAAGRDVLSTDVWASMGQENEREKRLRAFAGYTIDEALLAEASPSALVLHCLPAHRGEEITDAVIEGPQSAVFQQAENRLHVQKAVLEKLLGRR